MADCPGEALESCSRGRREALPLSSENSFFLFWHGPLAQSPRAELPETWWRFFSHVCAHLSIFHVHYISLQSLLSSPFLLLLLLSSFAFLFLFFLFPPRPGTERRPQEEEVGFKSYGIFLSTRRNLPRARFQLVIPKQTIGFRRYFWSLFWARCYINTFRFSTIRFSMDFSYSMILTLL